MSGPALGFMLTMWCAIIGLSILSLSTVLKNDKRND